MTFEQWCHSTGMDDARVVKHDMVSMEVLKQCWDYKEEENKKLKAFCKKVDLFEGEVIDGERFEAEALLELGKRARQCLKELNEDKE